MITIKNLAIRDRQALLDKLNMKTKITIRTNLDKGISYEKYPNMICNGKWFCQYKLIYFSGIYQINRRMRYSILSQIPSFTNTIRDKIIWTWSKSFSEVVEDQYEEYVYENYWS